MPCPTGSITSFPLQLTLTATDTLYDSVSEPLTIDFQWASRTTPPIFVTPKGNGITDEVGAGNANLSTLRFMNNSYTVASVQIIGASHKSWILPVTAQANNSEDIVITFSCTTPNTAYAYMTFVIPILRSPSGAPSYLSGLSDGNSNGPFSLQSCFPMDPRSRFVYYATCLAGISATAPTQQMYVFVSTAGLRVSTSLMTQLMELTGNRQSFLKYSPPFASRLTGTNKTITSVGDFSNLVQSTTQLLNIAQFNQFYPGIPTSTAESPQNNANAYKCVNIDPDTAIVDGQIQVDLTSGETLPDVLVKREALRAAHSVSRGMDPGRFEKYMASALGVILSIVLFATILWLIAFVFVEAGTDNPNVGATWITALPPYMLVALITGFVGFIVGAMLS